MPTFNYLDPSAKTLSPETMKALSDQLSLDIDKFCVASLTDNYRHHLGASVIGRDCSREIWYSWRWVKLNLFDGRMLRLFDRGTREEERFIKWLEGVGAKVWAVDPETGKQFKMSYINGHFGGSNDCVVVLPYLDLPLLGEFKTHNRKSFDHLFKKKLQIAKPEHYTQMCNYGKHYNLKYGLYLATCKDSDEIYNEIVELNWNTPISSLIKAEEIIYAKVPPHKISMQPNYFKCLMCNYQDICHGQAKVDINCRSCRYAEPVENGAWQCNRWNAIIPKDNLKDGCSEHVSITIGNV